MERVHQGAITCCLLAAALLRPGEVVAQESLDRAAALASEADFAQALAMLDRLERRTLDREELVRLYAQRATLHKALGNDDEMMRDLRSLATLTHAYQWEAHVPTEVSEAFRAVTAAVGPPLSIRARARAGEGTVEVRATIRGDASVLGAEALVHYRALGEPWRQAAGHVRLERPDGARVEYFAEAVVSSGTVVANHGSRAMPLAVSIPGSDDGGAVWWLVGGGAAVAAALSAVLFFLLRPEDDTRVREPSFPGAAER